MSKTVEHLMAAFAGESQANRKYLAYAKEGRQGRQTPGCQAFPRRAEAETIHAHAHLQQREENRRHRRQSSGCLPVNL